ncbi:MAG: response regulator [Acidobacteriaceae bacterium]|nr:response regulator [Acidobacteriaceae bacterium]
MKLVLIVDDSESVAASLALALETISEVQTLIHKDSRTVLERFEPAEPRVDALITDLHLPHANGLELIRAIRALPAYEALPAILVTADESVKASSKSDTCSPDAIFHKPFSPKEVCRAVRNILQLPS